MSKLTCAGCGGPVEVQHKAGLPPCDLHPPVVAELRMHLSAEITGPVDWPARFRAAADVAEKADHEGASWLLGEFADMATEDLPPHVVEAIGRALLGEAGGQDR